MHVVTLGGEIYSAHNDSKPTATLKAKYHFTDGLFSLVKANSELRGPLRKFQHPVPVELQLFGCLPYVEPHLWRTTAGKSTPSRRVSQLFTRLFTQNNHLTR